jgi:hypothetical protein
MGDQKQSPAAAEQGPDMQEVRMRDIDKSHYLVDYHMLPTEVVERLTALHAETPGELYQVDDLALRGLTMERIGMLEEGSDSRIELQRLVDFINQTRDVLRFAQYLGQFGNSKGDFPKEFKSPKDENDPERVRELMEYHYLEGFTPSNLIRMINAVHDLSRNRIPKSVQVTEQFSALVNGLGHATSAVLKHLYGLVHNERNALVIAYDNQLAELDRLWQETLGDADIIEAISGSMAFLERGKKES